MYWACAPNGMGLPLGVGCCINAGQVGSVPGLIPGIDLGLILGVDPGD
jgi:hypothetical protein